MICKNENNDVLLQQLVDHYHHLVFDIRLPSVVDLLSTADFITYIHKRKNKSIKKRKRKRIITE